MDWVFTEDFNGVKLDASPQLDISRGIQSQEIECSSTLGWTWYLKRTRVVGSWMPLHTWMNRIFMKGSNGRKLNIPPRLNGLSIYRGLQWEEVGCSSTFGWIRYLHRAPMEWSLMLLHTWMDWIFTPGSSGVTGQQSKGEYKWLKDFSYKSACHLFFFFLSKLTDFL